MNNRPLEGLRVFTFEQFGAGPYCTMFFADLGAEVIKVEDPNRGGDVSRKVGPVMLGENDSEYFQSWGANKKSITLDIKSPQGREEWLELVKTADAVVNNLRGDQPEKLGLEYKTLSAVNPALVCLHISAYGRENERRNWPGYDYLMQAEAGLMSLTGDPDHHPTRFGSSMIDFLTGTTGAVGLLASLLRAKMTQKGADVDVCLFDVALHQLSYMGHWYLNGGVVPQRMARSAHPSIAPVQTFPTKDGWIYVMCMTDKFWDALISIIGAPELAQDPRFKTGIERGKHRQALSDILDTYFQKKTSAEWIDNFAGILPAAPIYDVPTALANPHVQEVKMVQDVPHPERPERKMLAQPIKINGARASLQVCPPLGGNNDEILGPIRAKLRDS